MPKGVARFLVTILSLSFVMLIVHLKYLWMTSDSAATIRIRYIQTAPSAGHIKTDSETFDPKINSKRDFLHDVSPMTWNAADFNIPISFNTSSSVPRIVHFTWYSKTRLTFRFHHHLSVLSAHRYIKPHKFLFWHETPPVGEWWYKTLQKVPNIQMAFRKSPETVLGNRIKVAEHKSDVVRMEAILKYGGIYMDLDIFILKSLDPLLKYDTTLGYETEDGLCNGMIIAKPNAPFMRIWYQHYKHFTDQPWNQFSVKLPAVLRNRYPTLVHTEKNKIHRPNWKERDWLFREGKLYDWSKNYAVHLWFRWYRKEHSPEDIKKLNTTLGELMRFIYYGSPKLM